MHTGMFWSAFVVIVNSGRTFRMQTTGVFDFYEYLNSAILDLKVFKRIMNISCSKNLWYCAATQIVRAMHTNTWTSSKFFIFQYLTFEYILLWHNRAFKYKCHFVSRIMFWTLIVYANPVCLQYIYRESW